MSHNQYYESECLSLLREYYSSGVRKHAFVKKYHLSGPAILTSRPLKTILSTIP